MAIQILTADQFAAKVDFERSHILVYDKWLTVEEARARFEVGVIIKRFGTWAVTDYGVECLARGYPIEKSRLWEHYGRSWEHHMGAKSWVVFYDFWRAIEHGRKVHIAARPGSSGSYSRRFAVLKRDNYRCQLCGATAQSGATLEVDHKIPRAKGGSNDPSNLWTLCWSCNRGKSDDDLIENNPQ